MNAKFVYEMDLPPRAKSVYLYLHDRADRNGCCFPSMRTVAKDLGISKRTVMRAVEDLRQAKLIKTEQRYRENGGKSSLLFKLL